MGMSAALIYIPVWIDLKAIGTIGKSCSVFIYIPVWIDLKFFCISESFSKSMIYIPVWIDLKDLVLKFLSPKIIFTFQYG